MKQHLSLPIQAASERHPRPLTNFVYEIIGIETNLPALFFRVKELP
ncbi:MAG: hypothetical protein AAB466_09765 [Verrucomicrobiota bacterium]